MSDSLPNGIYRILWSPPGTPPDLEGLYATSEGGNAQISAKAILEPPQYDQNVDFSLFISWSAINNLPDFKSFLQWKVEHLNGGASDEYAVTLAERPGAGWSVKGEIHDQNVPIILTHNERRWIIIPDDPQKSIYRLVFIIISGRFLKNMF